MFAPVSTAHRILDAALQLINDRGYAQVGVREIARHLEMSPGNLSYHFRRKEDILFALLAKLAVENDTAYAAFEARPIGIPSFLDLVRQIFHNQYRYRGVYIGNQQVQRDIGGSDRFDYPAVEARRKAGFRDIFQSLHVSGALDLSEADIAFLVDFMSLFGRFWISEALLFNEQPDETSEVNRYLKLLIHQLGGFASPQGAQALNGYIV